MSERRVLEIDATPIDAARYARFGSLVAAGPLELARAANHGTADAWDVLAVLENARGERARCTASVFRCHAHAPGSVSIRWLERHAHSTQMFVPMHASRYLLVVAHGGDAPDLATLAAFVVEGARAITYAPGTWHHPMIALDQDAVFVNVIFGDGTTADCDEMAFDPPPATVSIPSRA